MKILLPILLVFILLINIFGGCVDNNQSSNDNIVDDGKQYKINTNYPRDHLGLNSEGEAAFTAACTKYTELKSSMSSEEARNALADALNDEFEFIKKASLSDDGYTIGIVFEDDTAALIFTNEEPYSDSYNMSTGSQFSTQTFNIKTEDSSKDPISVICGSQFSATMDCDNLKYIVPRWNDALIIQAHSLDHAYWTEYAVDKIKDVLFGWPSDEISHKQRDHIGDENYTPDVMLDYWHYGIIVYIGRGGYCSDHDSSIPGHHYLQCCDYLDFSDIVGKERNDQYITWRDQGRLILGGFHNERVDRWEWEYYIDTDLILEQAAVEPNAIVFMISDNSYRFADTFLNKGAGCFFGWDGTCDYKKGGEAFSDLANLMISEYESQTAEEAFRQLDEENKINEFDGVLKYYDNGKDVYIPSFGRMTLNLDSPPTGTSKYEIEFSPYTNRIYPPIDNGDDLIYTGVNPVNTTITIRAISSAGNTIESSVFTPNLLSGRNRLINITTWEPYGIILKADPTTVESDGTSTSIIYATLKTFQPDDVTEPTGMPLICREVEFITNFGIFIDSNKAMTDENGTAKVELMSDKDGMATVRAIVEKDGMESYKTQNITFGEVPYSFRLAERRQNKTDPSGDIIEVMSWGYYLVFKGKEDVDYYIITKNHSHPRYSDGYLIKEYSTTGQLPYEDDYYEELRLLTDEERAEWKKEYENGTRFYLFRGDPISIGNHSDSWKTMLSEKQNDYYNELSEECVFTIKAYNS